MIDLSKWERATWWNLHPDRTMRDFGQSNRTNPKDWSIFTDWEKSEEHSLAATF